MDLNCLEMGTKCDQVVTGESTKELIEGIHGHMRLAHGYSEAKLASDETDEMIRGAIWQSSRPPDIRTPRPDM